MSVQLSLLRLPRRLSGLEFNAFGPWGHHPGCGHERGDCCPLAVLRSAEALEVVKPLTALYTAA